MAVQNVFTYQWINFVLLIDLIYQDAQLSLNWKFDTNQMCAMIITLTKLKGNFDAMHIILGHVCLTGKQQACS